MKIFPAIDIKDKKCVRLVKGDFKNKTEYEMSPVEQAGKYKDHGFKNLHIVLGVVNDKDISSLIELFPKNSLYYFCKPDIPRGLNADKLALFFKHSSFKGTVYGSVSEAFRAAKHKAYIDDLIYIGGSTFVVAEVL